MPFILQWLFNAPKGQEKQSRDAKLYEICTPEVPYAERPADKPQYHGEAAVDIIAVHGLDSDPETGWSRKLPDGTRYSWLRERLPGDMHDARILSFSYPSSFYGDPTYTSIAECARQLLREIIRDRRHPGRVLMCPTKSKRPIVFLGHSFGGLVIKEALLIVNEYLTDRTLRLTKEGLRERQNYQHILSAVGGLFFFGTPHKGSPFSYWAEVKMWLGSMCGQATYPALIRLIRTHSLELHDMDRDFKKLYRGRKLEQASLFCYYEMKGVPLYPRIVVDQRSACMSDGDSRGFELTHKELNKFKAEDDPNYDQVLADLNKAIDFSAPLIAQTFTFGSYGMIGASDSSKAIELALRPANGQLDQLEMKLSRRRHAPKSCMWILDHPDFKRWVSHAEHMDAFWIHGKAGAGKSVLAAYIIDWLRSDLGKFTGAKFDSYGFPVCRMDKNRKPCGYIRQTNTVLFFFFGVNRSNQNVISFLGTLAHQLLSIHYDNKRLFAKAKAFLDKRVRNPPKMADKEAELLNLLVEMLKLLGGLAYIVIDGVEENDQDNQGIGCLGALSTLKKQLSSPPDSKADAHAPAEAKPNLVRLQIMVVCQATRSISHGMEEHLPQLTKIDISHYTQGDIATFIKTESDNLSRRKPQLKAGKDTIIKSLTNRAQGMFEMVNADITLLERYTDDVKDIDKWLENLPPTLIQTWEKVFMRLPSGNAELGAQRRIRLALKLLAVNAQPLSATELYYAYTIGTIGSERETDGTAKSIDSELKRLLRGREPLQDTASAIKEIQGLLDSLVAFDVRKGTVELAHDSVRKVLLLSDDPKERHSQNSGNERLRLAGYQFTEGEAHATAAELCMRVVQSSTLSHATSFTASPIPFVEYSWDQWKYHLKRYSTEPDITLDQMIRGVSHDTIAFLGALTEFVARDIPPMDGRYTELEHILCLKQARECLLPAIESLTTVQKAGKDELSKSLIEYRKLFAATRDTTINPTMCDKCEEFFKRSYQKLRSRFMPKNTIIQRLRIDALLEEPSYKKCPKMSGGAAALLVAARNLRTVAVRFAVNPVYTALISRAGGTTFSPVHPLVYVAGLLEECGSAPFWDQLSSNWDPVDPFICDDDDPQAGPARFVLQCFAWRELQNHIPANAESTRQYMRAVSRVQAQPNPGGRQLLRVSTANQEQVKRLHGMSGSQYITSYTALVLFGGSDGVLGTFIYNRIGQNYLRSLRLEDVDYLKIYEDPKEMLARHAPDSLEEAPVKEALEAIPGILKMYFVKYVQSLFEVFGNVASTTIALHAREMIAVAQGLQAILLHVRFLWETASRASLSHMLMAALLFFLRILYFPSVGAHHLNNPWMRLSLAVKEPTEYLQSQHHFSWSYLVKAIISTTVFEISTATFAALRMGTTDFAFFRQLRIDYPGYSLYASVCENALVGFTTFMHLCGLQRYMISVMYLLGTIVAGGYVMMRDQSSMHSILIFTVWHWFYRFLTIFMSFLLSGSIAAFGPLGILVWLPSILPVYYATKLLTRYQLAVAWFFSWPFQPLIWAGKLAWVSFLYAYVHVLRIIGILVLCGSVFLALHWFLRQFLDPYDIAGSVRQLKKAAKLARSTLKEGERRHIGEYPLGGSIEDDSAEQPTPEHSSTRAQPTPASNPPHPPPGPEPNAGQMNGHAATQASSQSDHHNQGTGMHFTTNMEGRWNMPSVQPPSKPHVSPLPKAKVPPRPKMESEPSDNATEGAPRTVDAMNTSSQKAGNLRDSLNQPDQHMDDFWSELNTGKTRFRRTRRIRHYAEAIDQ